MTSSVQKILVGSLFFLASCLVAIVGYVIAGWSIVEAIYMVIITIFGVGYGEVRPIEGTPLRLFTIGVIVAGCTSSIYVIGGFVQLIAEGELNRYLGARRMTRGIDSLKDHVIVCGYGRVGHILADDLKEAGLDFVIIDTNQDRLQEAETAGNHVIVGDASDESILEAAGISRARVLATVLPDDATNVYITLTARELSDNIEIIARGESPSAEKKLLRSGATKVVLPAAIGASRVAKLITRPSAEDLLAEAIQRQAVSEDLEQLGLQLTDIEVEAGSDLCETALGDVSLAAGGQFVVVAVQGADGTLTKSPPDDHRLRSGDTLVIVAQRSATAKLRKRATATQLVYRGVRS